MRQKRIHVWFAPDGSVSWVSSATADRFMRRVGGQRVRRRASHILPVGWARRIAFRALRVVFGDHGPIADWTRRWRGPHVADLRPVGGPVLGPFQSRERALLAESAWLSDNYPLPRRSA